MEFNFPMLVSEKKLKNLIENSTNLALKQANDAALESFTKKSAEILRNNKGEIIGSTSSYSLESIEKYVDLIYQNNSRLQNFVFLYNHIPEVQFPIEYLTSRICNGIFTVKRWSDDSSVYADSAKTSIDRLVAQKMKSFLTKPNSLQTFKQFLKQYFTYKYLVGNSFVFASGVYLGSNIFEYCENFWVLPAHNVVIDYGTRPVLFWSRKDFTVISKYKILQNNYDPKLVLHAKDLEPLEMTDKYFYGCSRLQAQQYPVANLCAVYEARNVIYTKRGALGAMINKKTDTDGFIPLTDDEKDKIRKQHNEVYGLGQNKMPYAIVDVPMEYVQFGMSIQDLQPFDETLASASVLAGAYNIDSVLIPRKDQSTFSNLKEAEAKVYTSMVIPEAKDFCEIFSNFLGLNELGYYLDVNYDHVEVLADANNKKETSKRSITERCKIEFNAGIITLNEWRTAIGKEKSTNPVYDKTIFEMDESELLLVKQKIG